MLFTSVRTNLCIKIQFVLGYKKQPKPQIERFYLAAKFLITTDAYFFEISKKLNGCHISPIEKRGAHLTCCMCVSCSCSDLALACEPVTPNVCLFVLFCLIFCELDSHIKSISCSRFFHSGNISKLEKIAHAFVSLRLDFCKAWKKSLSRLQATHNAAARLLTHSNKRAHITPTFFCFHWLPAEFRISFTILTLAYEAKRTHSRLLISALC